jgi:hypothetical protein
MTTYSYKDLILVENYNNYDFIKLDKIDIHKIYNSVNIFSDINNLKISDLEKYFPLFKLFNVDINEWKKYKYEFNITNLSPTDLNVDIKTIEIIQNNFMRYILKKWASFRSNSQILLLLILIDFLSKTIDINNKKLMNILIEKLEPEKNKILKFGIINENILNDLLNLTLI